METTPYPRTESDGPRQGAGFVLRLGARAAGWGGVLGVFSNLVNGVVSPGYFVAVMGWSGGADLPMRAVGQGALEGVVLGGVLGLIFGVTALAYTGWACPPSLAARHLRRALVGAAAVWVLGGALAVTAAAIAPDHYRPLFRGAPAAFGTLLRYAWVGGSISAVQIGGAIAAASEMVALKGEWRRLRSVEASNAS